MDEVDLEKRLESIPQSELDLPAGFDKEGKMVSLRELVKATAASEPAVDRFQDDAYILESPAVGLSKTPQLTELIVARLRQLPEGFKVGVLGGGPVDKERAIAE